MAKEIQGQWLTFYVGEDGSESESYNAYYAKLIKADSKDEAIDKFLDDGSFGTVGSYPRTYYDAIEMKGDKYIA